MAGAARVMGSGGGQEEREARGLIAIGNEPEFILMATGSHRRFSKQGNDRYDVSCTKITQVAV